MIKSTHPVVMLYSLMFASSSGRSNTISASYRSEMFDFRSMVDANRMTGCTRLREKSTAHHSTLFRMSPWIQQERSKLEVLKRCRSFRASVALDCKQSILIVARKEGRGHELFKENHFPLKPSPREEWLLPFSIPFPSSPTQVKFTKVNRAIQSVGTIEKAGERRGNFPFRKQAMLFLRHLEFFLAINNFFFT